MALTAAERTYVERVKREAALRGVTLQNADIWSSKDSALQKLATEVWLDPQRRSYLKVELTGVTLASGIVSLSSYTDLLQETVRNVKHSDGTEVSLAPPSTSKRWLRYERCLFSYYGFVDAAEITVVLGDGQATVAPDGTVDLTYNQVPTINNLRPNLTDDLIELHIGFAQAVTAARMAA